MSEKCSRCKRDATRGLQEMPSQVTTWFCTMHWNRLVRDRRIERNKQKSEARP